MRDSFSILFTLIALSIAGLWIASYFADCDGYWEATDRWSITFACHAGNAHCFVSHLREDPQATEFILGHHPFLEPTWYSVGIYTYDQRGFLHSGIMFPLWGGFLVSSGCAVLLAYPGLRGRLRRRRGLCLHCGYNLNCAPRSECPECGTRFSSANV